MLKINQKQQKILKVLLKNTNASSSQIHAQLLESGQTNALVTIKRQLTQMVKSGLIILRGSGPATSYNISALGRVRSFVNAHDYCAVEPDKRYGLNNFNFDLIKSFPSDIFSDQELSIFEEATRVYYQRSADTSKIIQKKELERLVIELSWKSSKIEGNTYTLLDTEKLILKHQEAPGHSRAEARMILNHKDAFAFIHEHKRQFKNLTRANLEEVHTLLVKGLGVNRGLRKKPVGVLGSKYQPLDNAHQINDAVAQLAKTIAQTRLAAAKAFLALVGISYIQPFDDGNKRTARLMANAILMAHKLAPLSYRSIDEAAYREAMLVFYELNSIQPIKEIFIDQYNFAARTYSVK